MLADFPHGLLLRGETAKGLRRFDYICLQTRTALMSASKSIIDLYRTAFNILSIYFYLPSVSKIFTSYPVNNI